MAALFLAAASSNFAQTATPTSRPAAEPRPEVHVASSAAYAELLLRRTELEAELESLVLEYTDEYPRIREIRYVLALVGRDSARLGRVKPADATRLTLSLGKLLVRRMELETELWKLRAGYKDEHPEVKRAKRKVEIYDSAINDILN